jgi:predicted nucleic acid-binding protein
MNIGPPCLVLIDERAGGTVASASGLAIAGTVGLIVHARKRGLIPSAKAMFEQLLDRGFRVGAETIREALAQAGE